MLEKECEHFLSLQGRDAGKLSCELSSEIVDIAVHREDGEQIGYISER